MLSKTSPRGARGGGGNPPGVPPVSSSSEVDPTPENGMKRTGGARYGAVSGGVYYTHERQLTARSTEVECKRVLLLRFCLPELTIFHACKNFSVSRTSLSTASRLDAKPF